MDQIASPFLEVRVVFLQCLSRHCLRILFYADFCELQANKTRFRKLLSKRSKQRKTVVLVT